MCSKARISLGAVGALLALMTGLSAWALPARAIQDATTSYPYNFSKIAWAGSAAVIAATDSHGDLYYFWEPSGTTTWHKQLVAAGGNGARYTQPSITGTGQLVAIAAIDSGGDLVYFAKQPASTTWARQTVATAASAGGYAYEDPSITVGSTGIVLIGVDNSLGELLSFTFAPGQTKWREAHVAYGIFSAPSVATAFQEQGAPWIAFITAASGGTLYIWFQDLGGLGWDGPQILASPGPAGSYRSASVAAGNGVVLVTAAETSGAVGFWSQSIGASTWSQQTVAAGSGHVSYASPAIAVTPTMGVGLRVHSYDVITATDQSGNLDFWWEVTGGTVWTPERVAAAGVPASYATPGISVSPAAVIITAINRKPGNVLYWDQPYGTTPWHEQLVAKG